MCRTPVAGAMALRDSLPSLSRTFPPKPTGVQLARDPEHPGVSPIASIFGSFFASGCLDALPASQVAVWAQMGQWSLVRHRIR